MDELFWKGKNVTIIVSGRYFWAISILVAAWHRRLEKEDTVVAMNESYSTNYVVVLNPWDGSSNIDNVVRTGSILKLNEKCLTDLRDDLPVSFQPKLS